MNTSETEYEALKKLSAADRRYRIVVYILTVGLAIGIALGGLSIKNSINHKIDGLVSGSIIRNNQREAEQKTIAKETTRYVTCIFVIPIDQRTASNQQKCFNQADLPGGLDRSDFSPYIPTGPDDPNLITVAPEASQPSQSQQSVSSLPMSSPQPSTTPQPPQSNNSQLPISPPSQTSILQPAFNTVQNILRVLSGG